MQYALKLCKNIHVQDEDNEHGEVEEQHQQQPLPPPLLPAGRTMRKTLSRKSPFLPDVLQALNDYNDIEFCEEYGKKVLLGEGSFGEVSSSWQHPIHILTATVAGLFPADGAAV